MLKRLVDVGGAVAGLLVLSPVMLVVAVLVYLRMGAPILFLQERPGYKGAPFVLLKFRTMSERRDHAGALLPDEQRVTRLGRFLRRTSLDELPSLVNVLRGDMSLVGPRPLLMEYLDLYPPEFARRHDVKPGLTGWSQIHGRNDMTWERKFALDVWYVDHRGFWLDAGILAATLGTVFRREGITPAGAESTPKYRGPCERKSDEVSV
ncbi:MAG TPA: sugar transferase [Nitrospiria bacterium]|nr:sugar transferase [Nitrospiria bacterium]